MTIFLPIALTLAMSSPPQVDKITPFVGDEIAMVAHLDLTRIELKTLVPLMLGKLADEEEVSEWSGKASKWVASLRAAGAKDLYILVEPLDIPGPPIAVVPLEAGVDAKAIGQVLCGTGGQKPPYAWPTCATIRGTVFAGTNAALDRVRRPVAKPRPELAEAFSRAGDGAAQVLLIPSAVQRRVFAELVPTLPKELGGGPMTDVTTGMRWMAFGLTEGPTPRFRWIVQATDPASARSLLAIGQAGVNSAQMAKGDGLADLSKIEAKVVGDRVEANLDVAQASGLVAIPLHSATAASRRSVCINNMKMLGLAFHNYHAARGHFPPAASRGKDGKPLLSWRVYLLPYMEQQALFKEFHLDEPWDSDHNKTLIARMPELYACPAEARKLRKAGKTTYLVPVGKATIFDGSDGVKLKDITDGTSNTIFVVDASDSLAVIWTKPDDWEVDPDMHKAALFGHHDRGTNFTFADGSVRFIKSTVSDATLRLLLTRAGGEVANNDDY
jgi:prepilin-type processing-associated H-X9-DG protein